MIQSYYFKNIAEKTSLFLFFVSVTMCNMAYGQNKSKNILKSENIQEIEEYLKNTYPDDPKKYVLKPKLIALKNREWTKNAKNAKPMEARPVVNVIPDDELEREEFKKLISESTEDHKEKTVHLLNSIFDQDISSSEMVLLLRNTSDCNIIIRIQGDKFYNLAVPAKGENFIIINKGKYVLNSNICGIKYSSEKNLDKSIMVSLGTPAIPKAVEK